MTHHTLPPFYKGDLVAVTSPHPLQQIATRLYVAYYNEKHPHEVAVTNANNSFEFFVNCEQVRLVCRGNLFKYRFGFAHDQLEFVDITQEALFWRRVDKMHEVRNPADNLYYTWTHEQAIVALQEGTAHAFFYSHGGPGMSFDTTYFGGYTFDDPDVARRMTTASLNVLTSGELVAI